MTYAGLNANFSVGLKVGKYSLGSKLQGVFGISRYMPFIMYIYKVYNSKNYVLRRAKTCLIIWDGGVEGINLEGHLELWYNCL